MSPEDPIFQAIDADLTEGSQDPIRSAAVMKMLPRLVGAENPVKTYSGLPTTGAEAFADINSVQGGVPPMLDRAQANPLGEIYAKRAEQAQRADTSNAIIENTRTQRALTLLGLMGKEDKPIVVGQNLVDRNGRVLFSGDKSDKSKIFGNIDPSKFTPESIAAFQTSGDYSTLVPREGDASQMTPVPGVAGAFYSKDKSGRVRVVNAEGQPLSTAQLQDMYQRSHPPAATNISMGQPVVVDTPQGPRLVQPANRPGAPAQVVEVPGIGPVTPNTPTTNRQAEMREKAALAAQQANTKTGTIVGMVDQALSELKRAGFTGSAGERVIASKIPGTTSTDLQNTIDTIKANIGFQQLADMRAASPTGGALGQIAVKELDFLQAAIASLNIGQGTKRLEENLKKVKTHFQAWQGTMQRAAQEQPQGALPAQAAPTSGDVIDFNSLPGGR